MSSPRTARRRRPARSPPRANSASPGSRRWGTSTSPRARGFAHADKGLYDPNTGTAVLTGNVRLTRGREQMNGETAEMNTRTGFTRLTGGRVTGLLEPNKEAAEPDPNPTGRPGARPCGEPKPAGAAPAAAQPKR
ncbi:MAG: hypothetical protein IPK81_10660 [Rhodospirillales bacterium]|nr:MAG: hypothetical protein IPK81_10660 [Rhodospirillales bacterium]